MAELILIEELQAYLVAQGVGQLPSATASTTIPSIWLHPRDGAPEPRTGEQTTVTIIDTGLAAPDTLDAWLDESYVDIIVRSTSASAGKLVHRSIRGLITPIGDYIGRRLWTMNDLLVELSTAWRPEQPLPSPDPDHRTFDRVASYRFQCRRKSLAGLPYTP